MSNQRPDSNERGSMTLWFAILAGGLFVVFGGLVYDGMGAATRQSELIDASWSLARTGAAQSSFDGTSVVVDAAKVQFAIEEAAARQWPDLAIVTVVTDADVSVTVTDTFNTSILNAIGVENWELSATRTSDLARPTR